MKKLKTSDSICHQLYITIQAGLYSGAFHLLLQRKRKNKHTEMMCPCYVLALKATSLWSWDAPLGHSHFSPISVVLGSWRCEDTGGNSSVTDITVPCRQPLGRIGAVYTELYHFLSAERAAGAPASRLFREQTGRAPPMEINMSHGNSS